MVDNRVVTVSNYATDALQKTLDTYAENGYRLVSAVLAKNNHSVDVMYLFFTKVETEGEWITTEDRPFGFCSKCNEDMNESATSYCPHCGSKMTWVGAMYKSHEGTEKEESGASDNQSASELLNKILSDVKKIDYHMIDCDAMVSQDEVFEIIRKYQEGLK